MGTDLFTSARGPGIIGTALAVIVLLGFGLLYMTYDDALNQKGPSLESVIKSNAKEIEDIKKRILLKKNQLPEAAKFKAMADEVEELQRTIRDNEAMISRLKEEVAKVQEERNAADATFSDYRARYREYARKALTGKKYDELKTTDGKVYQNVTIGDVDAAEVRIRHSAGATSVPLEKLPKDMIEFLQYDEGETNDFRVAVAEAREAHHKNASLTEKSIWVSKLKTQHDRTTHALKTAREGLKKSENSLPLYSNEIREVRRIIAMEERKAKNGGLSRAPQYREKLANLQARESKERSKIDQLRTEINRLRRDEADQAIALREAEAELQRDVKLQQESEKNTADPE